MKFEPRSEGGNRNYLKLEPGASCRGVLRGEPYDFRQHWQENRSITCPGRESCDLCKKGENKSAFRFRINFVTHENGALVAKVFEQGWNTYEALKALHEGGYDLEKTQVKITRNGAGKQTSYTVVPVPKGDVTPELEKKLKEVTLHDLGERNVPEPPEPEQDGDSPF